jgi:methylmalonyl-CoA decarboxylase
MVNGCAVGAACEMVLCCDFAIAAEPATFRMPPAGLGLLYSPIGFARFLSHIGLRHTKELFLTAQEISSERAKEIGLVHETAPPERLAEEVAKLARILAENSPRVIAATKKILAHLVSKDLASKDIAEIRELIIANRAGRDLREGLRAALAKRKPAFKGE